MLPEQSRSVEWGPTFDPVDHILDDDLIWKLSADVCACGAFDYWNGSVVCWVCEEIVVQWDAGELGALPAACFPGHE